MEKKQKNGTISFCLEAWNSCTFFSWIVFFLISSDKLVAQENNNNNNNDAWKKNSTIYLLFVSLAEISYVVIFVIHYKVVELSIV